ncbi:MAG TPA: ABC transporter substrate-binding protein, partial [Gammaproteobacteria bacterium]|nr:ABC transporter substrate-binding protein [Gammaproteobacteria bacterium]
MKFRIVLLSVVATLTALPAAAADTVKIGFVTTLTTPAGAIGRDMVEAANIALDHIGHKMGGKDVEFIVEDDGF